MSSRDMVILVEKISNSKHSIEEVAIAAGLNWQTFISCIVGESDFKISEMEMIANLLQENPETIFFNWTLRKT